MTRDQSPVSWIPVQHIIQAAQVCMELEGDRLRNLLQRSSQYLAPLGDPLLVDFGVHRWLKGQREEAYSDWLAWIVEQINTRERVYRVFGLDPAQSSKNHGPISVKRESPVEEGHEGRPGRLDLMVKFGEQVEIVVEVKVTDADFAATAKNLGYRKSISQEFSRSTFSTAGDFWGKRSV